MAMKESNATPGHGDPGSPHPGVQKGEFIHTGSTFAPLSDTPTSVNQKTGNVQDGKKHGY